MFDVVAADTFGQMAAESDGEGGVGTAHGDLTGIAKKKKLVGHSVVVDHRIVDGGDDVAMTEALVEHHLVVLEAVGGVVHGEAVLAPVGEDDAIEQ